MHAAWRVTDELIFSKWRICFIFRFPMTRFGTTPGDRRALRHAHAKAMPNALFLEPGVTQLFEEDRSVMIKDKEPG
jgi:hypothetical protein